MSAAGIAADRYLRRANPAAARRFATPGALARHCDPETLQTPALDLIDAVAVAVMDGHVRKQQIRAPPQIGKSQRISRWTPLWMLTCDPTLPIVIVSAEKELAVRWGRQIKRDVEANPDLGITLRQDSQAAGRWETAQGGGLYCTGIAAGTTGRPTGVLIIDDPIKDRAAAESKVMRERAWDFWENDGSVRARSTILMSTRWHVDDLAGRLQEREPGEWSVLSMPAIATSPDDALGREVGQEIQSANTALHEPGYYYNRQKTTSPYVWASLYQQHPTAAEGGIFKRGDWQFWDYGGLNVGDMSMISLDGKPFPLHDCTRFATIDLAASTKTSADFTVASVWAITITGDLVLLDRGRARVPEMDHAQFLAPLRQRWLGPYDVVHIESSMQTSTLAYALGRSGVPTAPLKADADKLTRALPYAGLVRQRRVWLPRTAPWLDEWLDEHADFPNAAHDDQVDTGAYAARVVLAHWLPGESAAEEQARRPVVDPTEIDLMTAQF